MKTSEQRIAYHLAKLIKEVQKSGVKLTSDCDKKDHIYFSVFERATSWAIGGHHNEYILKKEIKDEQYD